MAFEKWIGIILAALGATLVSGTYSIALTISGIEQHQAFSALGHPEYEHLVRLRGQQVLLDRDIRSS